MRIHFLGICGTFMGSLALLVKALGHEVTGSDAAVYPPMSTQLKDQGITLTEGYEASSLPDADLFVIGNAMSRGNPSVERILNAGLPYTSGPQFLQEYILPNRHVLAVSGTHGKTTTSSMLAWILEYAGLKPGYLIGGVPENFSTSARLGEGKFFVVEADEYDSAFFDKRSKFVHYRPHTLVINNIEFDHGDIFDDLDAICRQFHHLVRTIPGNGKIIVNCASDAIAQVLGQGVWSKVEHFAGSGEKSKKAQWFARLKTEDGSAFTVHNLHGESADIFWELTGEHNVENAVAAVAAAYDVGVSPVVAGEALTSFKNVKRRMEKIAEVNSVTVYDDFAHHPTAIERTLEGLRKKVGDELIIAVIEPRSNTMRMGVHHDKLAQAVNFADVVIWYQPEGMDWGLKEVINKSKASEIVVTIDDAVDRVMESITAKDHIVIMSNGAFGGIHKKIVRALNFHDACE